MRVAILFGGVISSSSGTGERVLQIANALVAQGLDVTLSGTILSPLETPHPPNFDIIELPDSILKLHCVLAWIAKLVSRGLTQKYDIAQIESFSTPRSLTLFFLLRPLTRKLIIVFHDKYFEHDPRKNAIGRLNLALQRILLTLFDASITPGLGVRKWFEELHGELASNRMIVIPNGIPNLEISKTDFSELRKKYEINSNAFAALFFGSMDFQPNYDAALCLYKTSDFVCREFIKKTGKELIFIVAGKGSEVLPKTCHYLTLGFINDLSELLALPNAIVLPHFPSYSGPHVKTMYAFLSKKPVIVTDDAVKDMPNVIPRIHFLPFDINKPPTLVACLLELYHNRELGERLALNAYLYSKEFSWASISRMHVKLYEQLLLNKRSESTLKTIGV